MTITEIILLIFNLPYLHVGIRIQKETIPLLMSGSDVMAQSKTGTGRHYSISSYHFNMYIRTQLGKTLAYAIPIVHCLREAKPVISRSQGLYAIIIVPTREVCKYVLTRGIFDGFFSLPCKCIKCLNNLQRYILRSISLCTIC